jgi:hypothetical protein
MGSCQKLVPILENKVIDYYVMYILSKIANNKKMSSLIHILQQKKIRKIPINFEIEN